MVFNLIDNGGNAYSSDLHSLNTTTSEFVAKSAAPCNIFGRDVDANIVPTSPFRLLPNNYYSAAYLSHFTHHIPSVYRDVLAFDIDNLSTLGRRPHNYYIYTLRKIRI